MRTIILAVSAAALLLLGGCGGGKSAPLSEQETRQEVQNFYEKLAKLDQESKDSLAAFNEKLADYSAGKAEAPELEKALDSFQDEASDIAEDVHKVRVPKGLPDAVANLLKESKTSFEEAYSMKEEASKSAASSDVTAEQFDQLNKNADITMLYGISKLNEARQAVGLMK
ncbi:hypothetical protein F4V43_03435 [Paenibacillus spiritus]|uniref:Inhibitor of growth protein N-terminal histone-binding domain-containing protein n=1 Tax=Paenibacillus spiritus TaxID=2496557 RepID=A0A5J5GH63_9BACL|nr:MULTISPECIES: hypothetical protein [Paenibacillus]KAA9007556.1 hypothetical protein F4V43_03435 [Paenibacillus spiritus]